MLGLRKGAISPDGLAIRMKRHRVLNVSRHGRGGAPTRYVICVLCSGCLPIVCVYWFMGIGWEGPVGAGFHLSTRTRPVIIGFSAERRGSSEPLSFLDSRVQKVSIVGTRVLCLAESPSRLCNHFNNANEFLVLAFEFTNCSDRSLPKARRAMRPRSRRFWGYSL